MKKKLLWKSFEISKMLHKIFGLEKYLPLKDTLLFHREKFFTVSASAESKDLFDWEYNRLYILHKDCSRSAISLSYHLTRFITALLE